MKDEGIVSYDAHPKGFISGMGSDIMKQESKNMSVQNEDPLSVTMKGNEIRQPLLFEEQKDDPRNLN